MNRLLPFIALGGFGCSETGFGAVAPPVDTFDPNRHTDRFLQTAIAQLDVLFVVDDSGSMGVHQEVLAENMSLFLDRYVASGSAYRLGLITTTPHGGELIEVAGKRWIDAGDPEPEVRFRQMIPGITGRSPEQGLAATHRCLEVFGKTKNAGFRRADAALHTILISNEHDYSSDIIPPDEFVDWYDALARDPEERTFSSVDVLNAGVSGPGGTPYRNVTRRIGGVQASIHSPGWEDVLHTFGVRTLDLQSEFFLTRLPVATSIVVELSEDGGWSVLPPAGFGADGEWRGWTYEPALNSIRLENVVPDGGLELAVSYTVATSGR